MIILPISILSKSGVYSTLFFGYRKPDLVMLPVLLQYSDSRFEITVSRIFEQFRVSDCIDLFLNHIRIETCYLFIDKIESDEVPLARKLEDEFPLPAFKKFFEEIVPVICCIEFCKELFIVSAGTSEDALDLLPCQRLVSAEIKSFSIHKIDVSKSHQRIGNRVLVIDTLNFVNSTEAELTGAHLNPSNRHICLCFRIIERMISHKRLSVVTHYRITRSILNLDSGPWRGRIPISIIVNLDRGLSVR